jgi:hypothetical protein
MMINHSLVDHPYAACYPLVSGTLELSLLESIREHGLRQPIVLWDDQERDTVWIVDGRNRYRALMEVQGGIKEEQVIWKTYTDDEEARLAVLDYNENRRQMTTAQKSVVAGRILQARESLEGIVFVEPIQIEPSKSSLDDHPDAFQDEEIESGSLGDQGEDQETYPVDSKEFKEQEKAKRKSKKIANRIRKQVASTLGIGPQAAQKGAHVVHRGVPELIHALEQGDLSLEAAYTLTRLESDEIQTLVSEGKESIRTRVRALKEQEKEDHQPINETQDDSKLKGKVQELLTFDHLPALSSEMRLTLSFDEEGREMTSSIVMNDPQVRQTLLNSLVKLGLLTFSHSD